MEPKKISSPEPFPSDHQKYNANLLRPMTIFDYVSVLVQFTSQNLLLLFNDVNPVVEINLKNTLNDLFNLSLG